MDYTVLLIACLFTCVELIEIHVYKTPKSNVIMGEHVQFHCLYNITPTERVILISWQKQNSTSNFENIASFFPPGQSQKEPAFAQTSGGQKLENRTYLINPSLLRLEAILFVNSTECGDRGVYRCTILYSGNSGIMTVYEAVDMDLTVPAEKPHVIDSTDILNTEDGESITFYCKANVGKPPGLIRWWLKRKDETSFNERLVHEPELPEETGECIFTVNATFTHLLNRKDNNATVRCTVDQNLTYNENRYREIGPINVFYRVRRPRIQKQPDRDIYVVGTDNVVLTCMADGNPKPGTSSDVNTNNITWFYRKSLNETPVLASEVPGVIISNNILSLFDLNFEMQGVYTCRIQNGFKNRIYTEEEDVRVSTASVFSSTVVTSSTSQSPLRIDDENTNKGAELIGVGFSGIIFGAIVAVIVTSFVCKRRNMHQLDGSTMTSMQPVSSKLSPKSSAKSNK